MEVNGREGSSTGAVNEQADARPSQLIQPHGTFCVVRLYHLHLIAPLPHCQKKWSKMVKLSYTVP